MHIITDIESVVTEALILRKNLHPQSSLVEDEAPHLILASPDSPSFGAISEFGCSKLNLPKYANDQLVQCV